ncbi:MAG: peptide chain release factor N(5)-glutamine methyltransferase [Candidatus Hydrogenedentota bacterium]|nr:MAG: peptide chain release factor N(5)-glutamine methyltransferase [Candidatus Hydrogenedentota bacterium]
MKVDAGTAPARAVFPTRIIDAVLEAESLLRDANVTDTPRLESEVLLADLLGIGRAKLTSSCFEWLRASDLSEFLSRIMRRVHGEPVAYIIGKKEFMGFEFRVDNRVLVPRPETEILVEHVLEMVQGGTCGGGNILDMGTGCGCIAVSLALLLPHASIHATDISEGAVALALYNSERHRVSGKITFYVGNLFSALPDALVSSIDVIVCNPPYVSDAEYLGLDGSIREFEPSVALRGGRDGLDPFRRIAGGAADYLVRGGVLAVEIGENQADKATDILERAENFEVIEIVRDLAGRQRVIIGRKTK